MAAMRATPTPSHLIVTVMHIRTQSSTTFAPAATPNSDILATDVRVPVQHGVVDDRMAPRSSERSETIRPSPDELYREAAALTPHLSPVALFGREQIEQWREQVYLDTQPQVERNRPHQDQHLQRGQQVRGRRQQDRQHIQQDRQRRQQDRQHGQQDRQRRRQDPRSRLQERRRDHRGLRQALHEAEHAVARLRRRDHRGLRQALYEAEHAISRLRRRDYRGLRQALHEAERAISRLRHRDYRSLRQALHEAERAIARLRRRYEDIRFEGDRTVNLRRGYSASNRPRASRARQEQQAATVYMSSAANDFLPAIPHRSSRTLPTSNGNQAGQRRQEPPMGVLLLWPLESIEAPPSRQCRRHGDGDGRI